MPLLAARRSLALVAPAAFAGEIPRAERRSGYELHEPRDPRHAGRRHRQPGMLWVLEGEALWSRKAGAAGRACADCHGDARASMKGVAARYPAFDAARGRPINLEQRINACRVERQQAPAARLREPGAARAHRLRRAPVARPADRRHDRRAHAAVPRRRPRHLPSAPGPAQPRLRQCHDDHWGQQLAGNVIPQAHPTGYPLYRLEWQGAGLAAAPAAQLPGRHARGAVRVRRARARRPRALSDVARAGDEDGRAGRPAVRRAPRSALRPDFAAQVLDCRLHARPLRAGCPAPRGPSRPRRGCPAPSAR